MSRHRFQLSHSLLAWLPSLALVTGCAGTPAATTPAAAARTAQATLTPDAWSALLAADTKLQALDKAQTQPFQVAGQVTDAAGSTLTWVEYAADPMGPRTQISALIRHCLQADAGATPSCTYYQGQYTTTGVALKSDAGTPVDTLPIAPPSAWEWSNQSNLDGDASTIVAGLSGDEKFYVVPDTVQRALAAVQSNKRRLVVVSPYGKQVGVSLDPIVQAATQLGAFDAVESIEFVRRGDVEALLPSLTMADTFIWVGAGVQQKLSKSAALLPSKGMNVSRGIAGDELYFGKLGRHLLDMPPYGGPGLIVLAGQNTVPDAQPDKDTLPYVWHDGFARTVVGMQFKADGTAALSDVIGASADLVAALGKGQDLGAALTSASRGALQWTSPMGPENRKSWHWPASTTSFWAHTPAGGSLTLRLSLVPQCQTGLSSCGPDNWVSPGKITKTDNWAAIIACSNPTFVGPYFTCLGGDSQPPGTKFDIMGVLHGTAKGDHLMFMAQADDAGPLAGALVLGNGEFAGSPEVAGGSTTYKFQGSAAVSPYTDKNGYCCTSLNPIQLIGDDTSQLSVLKLAN